MHLVRTWYHFLDNCVYKVRKAEYTYSSADLVHSDFQTCQVDKNSDSREIQSSLHIDQKHHMCLYHIYTISTHCLQTYNYYLS